MNEKIKNEVIEDAQTSCYGLNRIKCALNIGQETINGGFSYVFRKRSRLTEEDVGKVFREGHQITDKYPTYYMSIGLFEEEHPVGYLMPTLISVEGKPKKTIPLSCKDFANWPLFPQLFGEDNLISSNGRIFFKDNSKAQKDIDQWREVFVNLKYGPMHYVLDNYYSRNDIQRIEDASPSELGRFISELENFGTGKVRTITEEDYFPLLAKGLTGFSKSIKRRKAMRIEFFLTWAKCRRDLKTFAKEFNHPETRNWEWKPV